MYRHACSHACTHIWFKYKYKHTDIERYVGIDDTDIHVQTCVLTCMHTHVRFKYKYKHTGVEIRGHRWYRHACTDMHAHVWFKYKYKHMGIERYVDIDDTDMHVQTCMHTHVYCEGTWQKLLVQVIANRVLEPVSWPLFYCYFSWSDQIQKEASYLGAHTLQDRQWKPLASFYLPHLGWNCFLWFRNLIEPCGPAKALFSDAGSMAWC